MIGQLLAEQFGKLAQDLKSLKLEDEHAELYERMAPDEKATIAEIEQFVDSLDNCSAQERADKLLKDDESIKKFVKILFDFSQIIKNHKRQGLSKMESKGQVPIGKTRISQRKS